MRGHGFQTQAQLARIAVAQHLGAACVGGQVAAHRAAAFAAHAQRVQPPGIGRGLLHLLQRAACFGGQGLAGAIDATHPVHAPQAQNHAGRGGKGRGAAYQARVASLRHHGNARFGAGLYHLCHLFRVGGARHAQSLAVVALALIGAEWAGIVPGEHVGWAEHADKGVQQGGGVHDAAAGQNPIMRGGASCGSCHGQEGPVESAASHIGETNRVRCAGRPSGGPPAAASMTELRLIYARARNGVIGRDGRMPWHLPEDLAHFKRTTLGSPVIMGRKTWESLPPVFRPLPGRRNIVVTRQGDWQASGAEVAHSLEQALALCQDAPLAWVMGGADIYRQALPLAQQVVVTEIGADFSGDAFAPELDNTWQPLHTSPQHTSSTGLPHRFVTYGRKAQPGGAT